jgi:lipopolysaccharide export system permease protein
MELLVQRYMREVFDLNLIEKAGKSDFPREATFESGFKPTKRQRQTIHNRIDNIRNQMGVEQRIIRSHSRSIDKLLVEIHKKYSIPVACLVFVLIGAPLGILTRKGNMGVAAGISLLFFLLYWVCLIGGEELGDRQIISPILGMWIANILVGSFGIYLVILTGKEYRPIQWQKIRSKISKKSQL